MATGASSTPAPDGDPPWRIVEKTDGIERPPDGEAPWAPIVQRLEKGLEEEEEPPGEECEAARQLLAAARQAQTRALKEEALSGLSEMEAPPADDEEDARAHRRQRVPPLASWEEGAAHDDDDVRLLCMKNYAAVDAEAGSYGLIDRGVRETGIRTLVMHTPRARRPARDKRGRLLPASTAAALVRPGSMLRVRPTMGGGPAASLRVRYTTPARYYSPGEHVTTLCVGVDASDWQALLRTARI
jgi:hypothetical protein